MKKWLAGALLLGCSSVLYCQTSAYQDADGTSSIFLANAKASITYNVSDSKFNIGYLYEPAATKVPDFEAQLAQDLLHISKLEDKLEDVKNTIKDQTELKMKTEDYQKKLDDYKADADRLRAEIKANPKSHCWTGCEFGISLTGKPESDLTGQILQSGKTPADFGGGFLIGRHGIGAKDIFAQGPMDVLRDDWFLVNVTYDRSTFNTVATGATTAVAQHFNGFTILPVYNALLNIPGFSFLGGVGAGVNRTNNTGDLKKVQISTSQSSSGSVSVVSQSSACSSRRSCPGLGLTPFNAQMSPQRTGQQMVVLACILPSLQIQQLSWEV